ncbi:MAG: hypothetical protein K0U66_08965 [Gammaproteobacteria bacterium]|nr:hypothetical protein [Pseudomonadota bacterium]MCH9663767.1 hypothetical protein [Gammaproteobacteria bacterium]
MIEENTRGLQPLLTSLLSLTSSTGTLLCCALPAILVSAGLGTTVISLVGAAPWLVELSQHKGWLFGGAGVMLTLAGWAQMRARSMPCPLNEMGRHCARMRRVSLAIYIFSVVLFSVGLFFAYIAPVLFF